MLTPTNIKNYIDHRNHDLFKRLSKSYTITLNKILERRDDGNHALWFCRINQDEADVTYYDDIESSCFFTHELLHIDVISRGFTDFRDLLPLIESTKKNLLFACILGHINNMFAHTKFYKDFLDLGYRPDEFVSDYDSTLNINEIINTINASFDNRELPNEGVNTFISSYFTAKENTNPAKNYGYSELIEFLENKNKWLFQILDRHWKNWIGSTTYNNAEILSSLFDQTEIWHNAEKKTNEIRSYFINGLSDILHILLDEIIRKIYHDCRISIIAQSTAQLLTNTGNSASHVSWNKEKPELKPDRIFLNISAGDETIIWDLLHEYGHLIDGPPSDQIDNKLKDKSREMKAWENGMILLNKAPQYISDYKMRMEFCLNTYDKLSDEWEV